MLFFVIGVVLQSCVNFTNIQSARTLGPNREKDHYIYTRVTTAVVEDEVEGVFVVPEFVYKKKIKNKLDWGLKVGLDTRVTGQLKYQFVGNSVSKFAMSVMPETGVSFFPVKDSPDYVHQVPITWQAEIPLLMTYHFSNTFYFTAAPKLLNYYTPKGNFSMFAASAGIQFGKKVNWTFAYSYYKRLSNPSYAESLGDNGHIFEVGLKFNLFNNNKVFAPRFSFD